MTEDTEPSSAGLPASDVTRRAARAKREDIPDEMLAHLKREMKRTGVGSMRLLRGARDKPSGLKATIIDSWLYGGVRTASPPHLDYVAKRLAALPDATPRVEAQKVPKVALPEIASDALAEIRRHRDRTGIGGAVLLRTAGDRPEGLTPAMISAWLTGRIAKARPEHVAYVLARYRAWP